MSSNSFHRLDGPRCSLTMIRRGARLLSLHHPSSGREWLWAPSETPTAYWQKLAGNVPHRPMIGIDECLPTLAPCEVDGTNYPAHGDAWTHSWEVTLDAARPKVIVAEAVLDRLHLRLRREVRMQDDGVQLEYFLKNESEVSRSYVWALHPLIRWERGDAIKLSPLVKQVTVFASSHPVLVRGAVVPWPIPFPGIALDRGEFATEGGTGFVKLFIGPESGGEAAVIHGATGEQLKVRWNVAENPWLGLWICSGGRNGYWHIAVEPTTSPQDSLRDAIAAGNAAQLAPQAERRWTVSLSVSSPIVGN